MLEFFLPFYHAPIFASIRSGKQRKERREKRKGERNRERWRGRGRKIKEREKENVVAVETYYFKLSAVHVCFKRLDSSKCFALI